MPESSSSKVSVEGITKRLHLSEKEDHDSIAGTNIEPHKSELQGKSSHAFDPAVKRIIYEFSHFKINQYEKYPNVYNQLAQGQSPKFLVFWCSDSRVSPSHVLNLKPGEAFVVHNIANMVPAFNQLKHSGAGAAIEYAMLALKVENILIMGHSRCGGIHRLMTHPEDGSAPYDFIDDWMKIGSSAKARVKSKFGHLSHEKQIQFCEKESVNVSLGNILSYPFIQSAVANKAVKLRGGYYNFVDGMFEIWEFNAHMTDQIFIQ